MVLHLKDLIYERSEVYALFEVKNRSGIDFEVEYLKIFKFNGNPKRKSSHQKLLLTPVHRQDFPEQIRDKQTATFAIVLPKFTLGESERLLIELRERNGSRGVVLEVR